MPFAVGEGKESDVFGPPPGEALHDRFHQTLPHATIPQTGMYGQRSDKTDAAPVGGKIRADELVADLAPNAADGSARQRVRT